MLQEILKDLKIMVLTVVLSLDARIMFTKLCDR